MTTATLAAVSPVARSTVPSIAERVAASRAAQGLPPTITDPAVLVALAELFALAVTR